MLEFIFLFACSVLGFVVGKLICDCISKIQNRNVRIYVMVALIILLVVIWRTC